MKKGKATKRALVTSAVSLLLCATMLIGTTFAWFTDTASTAVNKIQSGTLDVALEYATEWDASGNPTKWKSAEGATLEFEKAKDGENQDILWEPGCTYELPELRIVNNDNLALKYKIVVSGITGNAKLNEAIEWTMKLDGVSETLGTEHSLAAKTGEEVSANVFTISGHMKEEAGNEYQGLSIDGIAITVYATQYTYEHDSIDDQYDKDAKYAEVIAAGKTFTGKQTIDTGIIATDPNAIAVKAIGKDADVTIEDGTFDGGEGGNNVCVAAAEGAKVTIKDGTFTVGCDANGYANAVIYSQGGNITIEGGFFYNNYSYRGNYYVLNLNNNNTGSITVKGGTFVNFNPAGGDDKVQPTNFVAEGYKVVSETQANGDVWYTVVQNS